MASESILPTLDQLVIEEPASPLMLMVSADLHWRRQEWNRAIDLATRVLEVKPQHFHALSMLVSSYGHLGQMDAAYPYAKRLLQAKRPNWTAVKLLCAFLGVFNLAFPKKRERYYRTLQRCDIEAKADRENLGWAQELFSKHDAANDAVAD